MISFYLDGKGFEIKTNPLDQARAPTSREWRLKNEGLKQGCTAKGKKEGAVNCNFMVGISHSHGVVLCDQYPGAISGQKFAKTVEESFPRAFRNSINPQRKLFLMDSCPRQNSAKARKAVTKVGGMIFKIPARSPDLNPIENFFNIVAKDLKKQAVVNNIRKETFEQFSERAKQTMLAFPVEKINKIIETMVKRDWQPREYVSNIREKIIAMICVT